MPAAKIHRSPPRPALTLLKPWHLPSVTPGICWDIRTFKKILKFNGETEARVYVSVGFSHSQGIAESCKGHLNSARPTVSTDEPDEGDGRGMTYPSHSFTL